MLPVTAVIISHNEEDRIGACIASVIDIVDEVLVIDSHSTDNTRQVALDLGARVESIDWKGYGGSKNYGNQLAKNDWILSLDCDEACSSELCDELRGLKLDPSIAYQIDRYNYYLGHRVRFSGWSPDWVLRLFHRSAYRWNDNMVHEKLESTSVPSYRKLKGYLEHNSYRSEEEHKTKTEKYAALKAKSWIRNGKSPGWLKVFFGAGFKAFYSFIIKGGFRDGSIGWKIAKMNAYLVRCQIRSFRKLSKKQ